MSQPGLPHVVEADGYCPFCQTVGCLQTPSAARRAAGLPPAPASAAQQQRNRIELKLNKILRHLGLDPDEGNTDGTS